MSRTYETRRTRGIALVLAAAASLAGCCTSSPTATPRLGEPSRPPLRVIAGRWAMIVDAASRPFSDAEVERALQSARAGVGRCLESRKIPVVTARVTLTWSGSGIHATVTQEDRGLGACAGEALRVATWPSARSATLEVTITARDPEEKE